MDEPLLNTTSTGVAFTDDWSADGRFIVYGAPPNDGTGALDVWMLPLTGDRKPVPIVQGPGIQSRAVISPDSRWLAYTSDESGTPQIYVQPIGVPGERVMISRDGGAQAQWRRDGKELFFLKPDATMMSVTIDTTHEFQATVPVALFQASGTTPANRRQFAVSRDGNRFLMISSDRTASGSALTVVVNWLASVQK